MQNLRERLESLKLTSKQKKGFHYFYKLTQDQRNNYLKSVIKFNNTRLDNCMKRALKGEHPYGWTSETYKERTQWEIDNFGINYLKWLTEADKYFDSKLLTMVSKLEKFGFLEDNIMLSEGDSEVGEGLSLEFYIRGFNTETKERAGRVYARLIWVECYEKESHYRFICTLKK